jgi:hypothetical protein
VASISVLFLFASALFAQSPEWDNVKRLPSNMQVRLSLTNGRKLRGGVLNVTDDSLVVAVSKSNQTFVRNNIARVAVRGQSHRGRNALIGMGVGAGVGLAAGAGADHTCGRDCLLGNNLGKAVFTPLGAILGLGVGVAIPTGGWHDIYRVK